MKIVTTKCPTRIDLSGGTLDLWPLWAMIEECTTINTSISIYTTCEITERDDKEVHIHSPDMGKTWRFAALKDVFESTDASLAFFKAHISHWKPEKGFSIVTTSQSPVGGGLGGSSSLSIAIYKTFQKWLGTKETPIHEMVRECANIEALVLATPTGLQDYYGAAAVGLNVIDFSFRGPRLETTGEHQKTFNECVSIVYTGRSHHSGINNWGVLKKFIDGHAPTREALHSIRDVSREMREACLKREWTRLPALFSRDFAAREMLSDEFMSPEIRELKKITDGAGALGFKICGAGGGGCVAVWSAPDKKSSLSALISGHGYKVLDASFL